MTTSQLTFTRFIAAFLLFIYHFGGLKDGEHLNLGVSYFYVLSGFVMMLAYGKKEHIIPKEFYINRFARIYPLHIFTLLLHLIIYILVNINYLDYLKSILTNALLIHTWIPKFSLSYNVPSWSISVEIFFYILFPFLFNYIITKWKFKSILISSFLFWLTCQIMMNIYYFSNYYEGYHSLDRYFLKYNPILHLNSFIIGILLGVIYQNTQYFNIKIRNYDFLIIITILASIFFIYFTRNLFIHNGLHSITFAILILLITLNNGIITKIFNHNWLIYLGEISFSFYLLQNPISEFLSKIFSIIGIQHHIIYFFTLLIIVIISSHLTYKYIEIPSKNKIKKILQKN